MADINMRSVSDVDDSDLDTDLCSANESDVKMPDISLSSSLHLDAYALVDETCLQFAELTKHEPVTGELQQFFKHVVDSLKNAVNPQPHTVAVVGKTGSGKSTLLCALVQSMVLPSSSLVACTSVITELCYHDDANFKAVINFVSKAEWRKVLLLLQGDIIQQAEPGKAETIEEKRASPASRAKARFDEVYPNLRNESLLSWSVDRLLDASPVCDVLGAGPMVITEADPETLQRKLVDCVASSGNRVGQPLLWPLVKSVQIYGKFGVLASGGTLVDLPGHGDTNDERNKIGEDYLKKADCILLVTDIRRAKDDQGTIDYLRRLLTQISVDGRTMEASVALVVTNADGQIGDNECPLNDDVQAEVDNLTKTMYSIKQEIKRLNETGLRYETKLKATNISSKKACKLNAAVLKLHGKVRDKASQYRHTNSAKNNILAKARSIYVRARLYEIYAQIQHELSNTRHSGTPKTLQTIPTELPIYCVGSRDYLALVDLQTNPALVFHRDSETGIPTLQAYITQLGDLRNLATARRVLRAAHDFLDHIKAAFGSAADRDRRMQQHKSTVDNKMHQLDVHTQRLVKNGMMTIRQHLNDVATFVESETLKASLKSPGVFTNYSNSVKWNTFRACMRRQGEWAPDDLNDQLTSSIFEEVKITWANTMNMIIPSSYQRLQNDLLNAITSTLEQIHTDAPADFHANVKACYSLGIASRLQDSYDDVLGCILAAQRLGSRAPRILIRHQLTQHYEKVGDQKGYGVYERMKDISVVYMLEHGHELFSVISKDTRDTLVTLASDIEANIRKNLAAIVKLFISLLGPSGDLEEQSPIDNPHGRMRILAFTQEVQPTIKILMDSVEVRVKEIA